MQFHHHLMDSVSIEAAPPSLNKALSSLFQSSGKVFTLVPSWFVPTALKIASHLGTLGLDLTG